VQDGYTSEDESKIVSTYLARAKSLIPSIASKVSSEMLGTKVRHAVVKDERTQVFRPQNLSAATGGSNNSNKNNKLDYSKMSDMDILNS